MTLCSYNIYDMIESGGEDAIRSVLSQFSCPKNPEIENFVKNNAIDFAKRKSAVTYMVMDEDGGLAAIFTLTHKSVSIVNPSFSKGALKRLARYSNHDQASNTYTTSAFLIAQFGKNYEEGAPYISGDTLMELAIETLCAVQRLIGGGVVYLECEENIPKLREFYANDNNQFVEFGRRQADDGIMYLQMMKII